jgi:hypothetical protein
MKKNVINFTLKTNKIKGLWDYNELMDDKEIVTLEEEILKERASINSMRCTTIQSFCNFVSVEVQPPEDLQEELADDKILDDVEEDLQESRWLRPMKNFFFSVVNFFHGILDSSHSQGKDYYTVMFFIGCNLVNSC